MNEFVWRKDALKKRKSTKKDVNEQTLKKLLLPSINFIYVKN
jgi:hypothetical protein